MSKRTTSRRARQVQRQEEKRKERIVWGVGLVGVLLIVIAIGTTLTSAKAGYVIDPQDPQLVAQGQQVYTAQCAGCHGANLEGEADLNLANTDGVLRAPPHDENGHTWHHNNEYLIDSIKRGGARLPAGSGVSTMPAYENILKPAEVGAVLSYIQSTWPADILAQQSRR